MNRRFLIRTLPALLIFVPQLAFAASLTLSPSAVSVAAGDTFVERVLATSPTQAANAVSGTLSFPTDLFSVVSTSKANSVLTLWVQDPSFSNSDGTVDFSGVVPNPGFTGSGTVFSVTFQAKQAGQGTISFLASAILANDGNGTDILSGTNSSNVTVTNAPTPIPTPTPAAPTPAATPSASDDKALLATITSSTHPDQNVWYPATHVVLDWTNAQGVTAVRIGYDKNKDGEGVVLYNQPISHKEIDLGNGVWYFHVAEDGPNGWGPVATFTIHIDTSQPTPIPVAVVTPVNATTSTSTPAVGATVPWFVLTLPTLLLSLALLLMLAWVLYLLRHHGPTSAGRRRGHAHALVHQQFGGLRAAVSAEVLKLEHSRTKRELTKQEEMFATRMQKMLDTAEEVIEKEIE
jgi:hypothetical protein